MYYKICIYNVCSFDVQRVTTIKNSCEIYNIGLQISKSTVKKNILTPVFCNGKIQIVLSRDYAHWIFL